MNETDTSRPECIRNIFFEAVDNLEKISSFTPSSDGFRALDIELSTLYRSYAEAVDLLTHASFQRHTQRFGGVAPCHSRIRLMNYVIQFSVPGFSDVNRRVLDVNEE